MAAVNIKTSTKVAPQCYAYTTPGVPKHDGWVKIGYTERDVETRINEQTQTVGIPHKTEWVRLAKFISPDYELFKDTDFHAYLAKLNIPREKNTEWFKIDPEDAKKLFIDFTDNHGKISPETAPAPIPYTLRDEQKNAVEAADKYFRSHKNGEFLWNAKPRFGKTLSAYDLCLKLGAKNILIVTNRPAIANSWYSDYLTFLGPESGYIFVSNVDGIKDKEYVYSRQEYNKMLDDNVKGCIEFVSLQDLKGSIYFGGHYDKLSELSEAGGIDWDLLIIDEAHEGVDTYKSDTAFNHIKHKNTLHLSGTPFKALANDKFPDEAIYNWTYADEQRTKERWDKSSEIENPYESLPQLNLYTYQMSDIVRDKAERGVEIDGDITEYAFDLNEFFKTDESGRFIHDNDVDKFLDALTTMEKFPFSTEELRAELKHTFWILKNVASAKALAKKLKLHPVFKDYEIVLAAGDGKLNEDDEYQKAFDKVTDAIAHNDKTITLSVGQLTTGVTIPEWTAVLMLSNMSSPSLYMQAAFRAQNPHIFTEGGEVYRKKNAYVFDFDPARTLTIFEQFANDLIPETSGEKGDFDSRKNHVRKLLNFFPVYGEDEAGEMIALDAEKVLTIPRRIHAKEVVERGFMSNFLFSNISGIFGAPKEIIEIINNMQQAKEPKKVEIDERTKDELNINNSGEVEVPAEQIIGIAGGVFGEKVYANVEADLVSVVDELKNSPKSSKKDELKYLRKTFSKPIASKLMEAAKENYGSELKKSTQNRLENKIQQITDRVVDRAYGDYNIRANQLKKQRDDEIALAQQNRAPMVEITKIEEKYEEERKKGYDNMLSGINEKIRGAGTVKEAGEEIVKAVETDKKQAEKDAIEGSVRDHLRGFSRTIPSFLMAYGTEDTTLENFDKLVPEDVFWEVTKNPNTGEGVTLQQFKMLRDGGDYITESGEKKHFDGHLFDEVVFNDAVKEFMRRRADLADYFNPEQKGDIFDYIPPQRTNQIFTPKSVVKTMADELEKNSPGCFDDPNKTFADLYMKSGLFITEIIKRLYNSEGLKSAFPNGEERIRHIIKNQVYGMAPTEILYRITANYILGFDDELKHSSDHNFVKADAAAAAKEGRLKELAEERFGK